MTHNPMDLHGHMLNHDLTPAEAVQLIVAMERMGMLPEPDVRLQVRTDMTLERLGLPNLRQRGLR